MAEEIIGNWTREKLNRHIQSTILATPASLPPSLSGDEIEATSKLKVSGNIDLSPQAVQQLKVYLGL
jgi:hypothetical protein